MAGGAALITATVVLCTRDRADLLPVALAAIAAAAGGPDVDILVVEQGSSRARSACQEIGLDAVVVTDTGFGVSRARNLGAAAASGEVVLFTDDDCEVPLTWVAAHLRALADDTVTASFGEVRGLSRQGGPEHDPTAVPALHRRGAWPWNVGHSSNMAIRRSAFLAVGGFDERLGPGASRYIGEDADLIWRLLCQGATLASGTGEPVRHLEWRSPEQHRRARAGYEAGAGAFVGRALRSRSLLSLRLLAARLALLGPRWRWERQEGDLAEFVTAVINLVRGLVFGARMSPWPPLPPPERAR